MANFVCVMCAFGVIDLGGMQNPQESVIEHLWSCLMWHGISPHPRGALKGTNLGGQTEPKHRFSLIMQILTLSYETKRLGKRRLSQKTTDWGLSP